MTSDTSREAFASIKSRVSTLQDTVLALLTKHSDGLTVHEAAAKMDESVASVNPRFSELYARAVIVDSGNRRKNASGRNAAVWQLAV